MPSIGLLSALTRNLSDKLLAVTLVLSHKVTEYDCRFRSVQKFQGERERERERGGGAAAGMR